jgi:hypothetical protein
MAYVVLAARLAIPAALVVYSLAFLVSVRGMAQSERLFPIVMIALTLVVAGWLIVRESMRFAQLHAARGSAEALDALDADGLRGLGWRNALLICGACVVYLFELERLGLLVTSGLVYLACAATLLPRRSVRHWLFAILAAVVAGIVFDLVFRVGLELPVTGP